MSVDPDISVLQGSEIADEPFSISTVEQVVQVLCIDWTHIPGTNVRIYADFRPEITGAQNIVYGLRRNVVNPVGIGTLGATLLDSITELPGGPRNVALSSGVIAKPAPAIDAIQLTTRGVGGSPANTSGTVLLGIETDVDGPIVGYSNNRGFITYSLAPETFLTEYRVDWSRFKTANVRVSAAMHYRNLNFAVAPFNLRLGGTYHGVDGTIIASTSIGLNFDGYASVSAVIANPGGFSSLKITFGALGTQFVTAPFVWIQESP